jgi:hypothetical protein
MAICRESLPSFLSANSLMKHFYRRGASIAWTVSLHSRRDVALASEFFDERKENESRK